MPPFQYNRWLFNLTKPQLSDVRVRKALAHIIDYNYLVNNVRAGMAVRTGSPILPTKSYYPKGQELYDFNIEKAKGLLKEAGWSDSNGDGILDKTENGQNVKLTLEILVPISRTNQLYAESVTETGRLAGIEIKAVNMDISEISKKSRSGDFESAFMGMVMFPGLTDLSQRYHSRYLSPAGDNRSRYVNPQVDVLLERIAAESDEAKRNQLYLEAQKIIYNDLPEVFILAPYQLVVTAKKFNAVTSTNRPGYYEHLFKLKAAN
jgi:peptide/nickel transport system substrate-binding protein